MRRGLWHPAFLLLACLIVQWSYGDDFGFSDTCSGYLTREQAHAQFLSLNAVSNESYRQNRLYPQMRAKFRSEALGAAESHAITASDGSEYYVKVGAEQSVLMRAPAGGGAPETVWSSLSLVKNGAFSPVGLVLSPDHTKMLLRIVQHGSLDDAMYLVLDVPSGKVLDRIEVLPNIAEDEHDVFWLNNQSLVISVSTGKGVQYYRHLIGSARRRDQKLEEFRGREIESLRVVDDWLFIETRAGQRFVTNPSRTSTFAIQINFDEILRLVGASDSYLFVEVAGAHNFGQIVRVDFSQTTPVRGIAKQRTVVPETRSRIKFATISDNHMIVVTANKRSRSLKIYDLDGGLIKALDLPRVVANPSHVAFDSHTQRLTIRISSQVSPAQDFVYDLRTSQFLTDPFAAQSRDDHFEYVTELHEAISGDGTIVPVRVIRRADLDEGAANPILIGVYGGFDIEAYFDPKYDFEIHNFIRSGGIFVAPAIRGGGEFGGSWHERARTNKQKAIEDIFSTVTTLRKKPFMKSGKIAIIGESNGALLSVAAAVQRPEFFDLVVAINGPYDVINLSELDPIHDFTPEYGSAESAQDIQVMQKYAPLENIKRAKYPAFLFVVGEKDTRVDPEHTLRMWRALSEAQVGADPVFVTMTKNSGHWNGSTAMNFHIGVTVLARIWSTVFERLGMTLI